MISFPLVSPASQGFTALRAATALEKNFFQNIFKEFSVSLRV